jgi:hypothetical protein
MTNRAEVQGALECARLSVRVFPVWGVERGKCLCPRGTDCGSPGKHPIDRGWQAAATTKAERIKDWGRVHRGCNFGIHGDDLVTVDVDPRNGGSLDQVPERLQSTPWAVRTGGDGVHLSFVPNGQSVPSRKVRTGIDLKARGGFVVAPGSRHVSGRRYEWVFRPRSRESLETRGTWPAEWLWPQEAPEDDATSPRSRLTDLLNNPPQFEGDKGGREDWLAKVAGHYAKRHPIRDDYEFHVRQAAALIREEPLEEARVVHTLNSIWGRERAKAGGDAPASNLPREFWGARPLLAHIRNAAHARQLSPDAVFQVILARVAAAVSYELRLPAIKAAPSPLCYFACLIGDSGVGKSGANDAAEELLPLDSELTRSVMLGSGEGIVEAFFDWIEEEGPGGKTKRRKVQVVHAAYLYVDEGTLLEALRARSGSTTLATLRTAWSGGTLGQDNARLETKRVLRKGSYTLGLVAGFQQNKAGPLLNDAEAGTPQRFAWASATDPEIPEPGSEPAWPGPLRWQPPPMRAGQLWGPGEATRGVRLLTVDPAIEAELKVAGYARATGRVRTDPLDAHAGLLRLRIAALLALLDDRFNVTTDDWRLAGVVLDTSNRVRAHVQAQIAAVADEEERKQASRRVRVAVESDAAVERRRVVDRAEWIARKVQAEPDRWTRKDLRMACRSDRRPEFDDGLDHAKEEKWVVEGAESGSGDDKRALRPGPRQVPERRK